MNYSDITHLVSGSLQVVVAWYALRLGRLLGIIRTGWLVFSGLSLLAVIYLMLSFAPFLDHAAWAPKLDVIYAMFSGVLFIGIVRLKNRFDKNLRGKDAKHKESQFEYENKLAALTKANEDWPKAYHTLQQSVAGLQAELAEQKASVEKLTARTQELTVINEELQQSNTQFGKTNAELQQAQTELLQANIALQQSNTQLQQAQVQLQETATELRQELARYEQLEAEARQEQIQNAIAAQQQEATEQATQQAAAVEQAAQQAVEETAAEAPPTRLEAVFDVAPQRSELNPAELNTISELLRKVSTSVSKVADQVAQSRVSQISQAAKLMREHARNIGAFMTRDRRGKQLPDSLAQLARQLSQEQTDLAKKVDSVQKKLERLQKIVATPSAPTEPSAPVDCSVPFIDPMIAAEPELEAEPAPEFQAEPEPAPEPVAQIEAQPEPQIEPQAEAEVPPTLNEHTVQEEQTETATFMIPSDATPDGFPPVGIEAPVPIRRKTPFSDEIHS